MLGRQEAGGEVDKGMAHSEWNKKFFRNKRFSRKVPISDLLPCSSIAQVIFTPQQDGLKAKSKKGQRPILGLDLLALRERPKRITDPTV